MAAIGRLVDLVLDCEDASTLAAFWAAVLDRSIEHQEDGWVGPSGGDDGHRSSFQAVRGYRRPQWPGQDVPQQVHLDILVEDLAEAEAEVRALGATALNDILDPGPSNGAFMPIPPVTRSAWSPPRRSPRPLTDSTSGLSGEPVWDVLTGDGPVRRPPRPRRRLPSSPRSDPQPGLRGDPERFVRRHPEPPDLPGTAWINRPNDTDSTTRTRTDPTERG